MYADSNDVNCSACSKSNLVWALLSDIKHPLCVIEILFGKVRVHPNERISRWNYSPHNTSLVGHQHQPLHPLPLTWVFPLIPDEVIVVDHMGDH